MRNLILFFIATAIFTFPADLKPSDNYELPEPVVKEHFKISVEVLPQVELISIVQEISKYPSVMGFLMTKDSSAYKRDVLNHFSSFSDHPAVRMFDRLSLQPRMLNFSAPSNIMLYTDRRLDLREDIIPDGFVLDRAHGIDTVRLFLELMSDFAHESSFNEFFEAHRDFYLEFTDATISNLGSADYVSELEGFYGISQKSYNIVLVSLYGTVGYGNSLIMKDGRREIYNTMGPRRVMENIPFYGDEASLKYIIRHEFSHPFVNPLTEKYWDYVKEYSSNYDSIPEVARKTACGDWQECVNEFIIRAITTHLAYHDNEETGKASYNRERSKGVSCLDALVETVDRFQREREKYPTLESFYPALLDVMKNLGSLAPAEN